jgi:effector-binding domain-containing protein
MRFLIEIVISLILVGLFFIGLGFLLPSDAYVERSIDIERPLIHVYDTLNSNRRYTEWAPWKLVDPKVQYTPSRTTEGVGAGVSWTSDHKDLGNGEQEITAAALRLEGDTRSATIDFRLRPAPGLNGTSRITIKPADIGVKVIWGFQTKFGADLVARYRGLYLDGRLGDELQVGLARLKALLESSVYARDYADIEVGEVERPARRLLVLGASATSYEEGRPPDVAAARDEALDKLGAFLKRAKVEAAGFPMFAITRREVYTIAFDVMVPVPADARIKVPDDMQLIELPAGRAVVARHIGNRLVSNVTYEKARAYMFIRKLEADGRYLEEFLSDPATTSELDFETNIIQYVLPAGAQPSTSPVLAPVIPTAPTAGSASAAG